MGWLRGHDRFVEHRDDFDAASAAVDHARTPAERNAALERSRVAGAEPRRTGGDGAAARRQRQERRVKALLAAAALGLLLAVQRGALDGLGPALLLVLLAAVAVWALGGRSTAGRSVAVRGHAHGSGALQEVATHEAGHAVAARALGGRVRSATVSADGRSGLVRATLPTQSSQAAITFWAAGRIAAGTSRGASADDDLIRRELRTVPSAERGRMRRAAERDAARIVSRSAGPIRRDAARLIERRRL
jgi:hypothetical protein